MSVQNSLVTKATDAKVLRPKSDADWEIFRRTQSPGSGTYHAMNKDGVVENFGGVTSSVFYSVVITETSTPGNELLATPTGGTAPYTYKWTVQQSVTPPGSLSSFIVYDGVTSLNISPQGIVISGSDTNANMVYEPEFFDDTFVIGLAEVEVTDFLGVKIKSNFSIFKLPLAT